MLAHVGHTLRVISRTGTDKKITSGDNLAHRIERTAQLVRPHRAQIFTLEPDVGAETFRQMGIPLQGCRRKHGAHGVFGCTGAGLKISHAGLTAPSSLKGQGIHRYALNSTAAFL